MADAGQFAKDADILLRVGTNASATVKAAGWFDKIVVDVEANINVICRYDFTSQDTSTTFAAGVRGILVDTAASLAAIEGIIWDMDTWPSTRQAEDAINVLRDIAQRNLGVLQDKNMQKFMRAAT